jgi:hypothetical protein
MSLGTFTDLTHATINGDSSRVATFVGNQVIWPDGTVWTETPNAGAGGPAVKSYSNALGLATFAVQNGTSQVLFVDSMGTFSIASFTTATHVTDGRYAGIDADFGTGTVTWTDGTVWTQTATPPPTISGESHVRLTGRTTMIALDRPLQGVTGTRTDDSIVWLQPGDEIGIGWLFFDTESDQLNAIFEMTA